MVRKIRKRREKNIPSSGFEPRTSFLVDLPKLSVLSSFPSIFLPFLSYFSPSICMYVYIYTYIQ